MACAEAQVVKPEDAVEEPMCADIVDFIRDPPIKSARPNFRLREEQYQEIFTALSKNYVTDSYKEFDDHVVDYYKSPETWKPIFAEIKSDDIQRCRACEGTRARGKEGRICKVCAKLCPCHGHKKDCKECNCRVTITVNRQVNDGDGVGKKIKVDGIEAEIVKIVDGEEEVTVRFHDDDAQCENCDGSGKVSKHWYSSEKKPCAACGGTGKTAEGIRVPVVRTRVEEYIHTQSGFAPWDKEKPGYAPIVLQYLKLKLEDDDKAIPMPARRRRLAHPEPASQRVMRRLLAGENASVVA